MGACEHLTSSTPARRLLQVISGLNIKVSGLLDWYFNPALDDLLPFHTFLEESEWFDFPRALG